ncbi:MAG: imidazole glycerol phosphate synthase subunit HisH [Eubacteriales bacterium]
MIAIVDYGVGNIFSLRSSFSKIGYDAVLASDEKTLRNSEKIILPGVGAFGDAKEKLISSGLCEALLDEVKAGKPMLGICLGMQLLFDKSYEFGEHTGLSLVHGSVRPISDVIPENYKIPHIGWNALDFSDDALFRYIKRGDFVYFVHSFYGADCEKSVIATTEYGAALTAAVRNENVYGVQFHPEKSGDTGLSILRAFCEMKG